MPAYPWSEAIVAVHFLKPSEDVLGSSGPHGKEAKTFNPISSCNYNQRDEVVYWSEHRMEAKNSSSNASSDTHLHTHMHTHQVAVDNPNSVFTPVKWGWGSLPLRGTARI